MELKFCLHFGFINTFRCSGGVDLCCDKINKEGEENAEESDSTCACVTGGFIILFLIIVGGAAFFATM